MRCLKRYIARQTYNTLLADPTAAQPRPPRTTTTIIYGAGPIGTTRRST
jgi:hypothetical protein